MIAFRSLARSRLYRWQALPGPNLSCARAAELKPRFSVSVKHKVTSGGEVLLRKNLSAWPRGAGSCSLLLSKVRQEHVTWVHERRATTPTHPYEGVLVGWFTDCSAAHLHPPPFQHACPGARVRSCEQCPGSIALLGHYCSLTKFAGSWELGNSCDTCIGLMAAKAFAVFVVRGVAWHLC